jgi:outer membrane receptor protein involved in Fe transport
LNSSGGSDKSEEFFNVILGMDFHINKLNVLTLSGHYAFENEIEHSDQNYSYKNGETITDNWLRNELTTATNPKWEYELQYKKDFKGNKDQNLLFSALGRSFSKDKKSIFENITSLGSNPNSLQKTHADFKQAEYTFKLDYVHPFSKKYTLETGAQYVVNDMSNDYSISNFTSNIWVNNPNFTNVFNYNQGVLGVYSTGAYENKKWGVKLGLRLENTDLKTELENTNEINKRSYTNLFPSAHTSYKVSDKFSLQAGYSKRIFRPRLWSLNPFSSFRDNFNISTGNPDLNPEYTNSFEITSIYRLKKMSLNFGIYHRLTKDVVERVITFENNVSTSIPQNIGTNNATGIEFNTKYSPKNWVSINVDVNFNIYKREGEFGQTSFDFTGQRWSAKAIGKFKLPAKFSLEVTGDYRSEYKTVQQTISDNLFMNIGLRKKILKGKLTTSLSVRDVFASRKRESIADQINFYRTASSIRGRFITLGLSFGFGKGEAMEFSGQKHF